MIFLRTNLPNFVHFNRGNATVSPFPLVLISFGGTAFPQKIFGGTAFPAFPLDYTTDVTTLHTMDWKREYARGLTYQTLVNAFDDNLFTVTKGRDSDLCDRIHFGDDDDDD